jgi:SprB repeat
MVYGNLKYLAVVLWVSGFLFTGCSSNEDPGPIDCEASTLELSFTSSDPTSCGANDGSIIAVGNGGDGSYQFALDAQPFGMNSGFSGLGAGIYQLKLKDKSGCERTASILLKSPDTSLAATVQISNSGCNTTNGTLAITATGGVEPYSYSLDNGTLRESNTFYGLGKGSYIVKVTDNAGCSVTQTVNVQSGIKFSTDVKRIIDTYCAISGCHMEGGNISFKVFENLQKSASDVKARTQSGNMPKNGPKLQQADIDAIACWVDDGALDN